MRAWVAGNKESLLAIGSIAVAAVLVFALFGTVLDDADVANEGSGGSPTPTPPSSPAEAGGRAGEPQAPPEPTALTVRGEDLELRHPDGAVLRVPAGSIPAGTGVTLQVSEPDALSLLGPQQPSEIAWSISANADPSRPVELTVPYEPEQLPSGARPLVATYDELSGLWLPVETTADENAGLLTASLPDFSPATVIVDRVAEAAGTVSWLENQAYMLGNRTQRPDCSPNPRPGWVEPVEVTPEDGRLLACIRSAGDGFAVHLVNNRSYPVVVAFDRPFFFAQPYGVESEVMRHAGQLVDASGRSRVSLLPDGAAAVVYDPLESSSGHATGYVRRDAGAMLMFLAYEIAQRVGVGVLLSDGRAFGEAVRRCYARTFSEVSELTTVDLVSAGGELIDCVDDVLTRELEQLGFEPGADGGNRLWSGEADALPPDAKGMVGGLRLLRALESTHWMEATADHLDGGGDPAGDPEVRVRWEDAP